MLHDWQFATDSFNTGRSDGVAKLHLDGELHGTLGPRTQTLTWDPERVVIGLGLAYIGVLDEVSIFRRALEAGEVRGLFGLDSGVTALIR